MNTITSPSSLLHSLALFSCACILHGSAFAQTYVNKEWEEFTGLPDNIQWTESAFDPQGNLLVVGNTLVAPGNTDVLLTKYDREGTMLWQQTHAGAGNAQDYGVEVAVDAAGNIYVAATVSNTNSQLDFAILKYTDAGVLIWDTEWNGPANLMDVPSCLAVDANGGVFAAGATFTAASLTDYATLKLNSSGVIQWTSTYDHAGLIDAATGIRLQTNGDAVVTGASANTTTSWDYATLQYDATDGSTVALNRVNVPGVGLDNPTAIARDANGNMYITGYTDVAGNQNFQTIKLSPTFGLVWVKNFNGQGLDDVARSVGVDDADNVYITGHMDKTNGGSDFITIKYSPTGTELWAKRYTARDGTRRAEAVRLTVTGSGDVYVAGTVDDGGGDLNFRTIQYDTDGNLRWEKTYAGPAGEDMALDILADNAGNVFVVGITDIGGGTNVYATIKYTTYTTDHGVIYDQFGEAFCMAKELIVKFDPDEVNTSVVDDLDWQFGDLEKVVSGAVVNEVCLALGLDPEIPDIRVVKIHMRLTTANTTSISRLGETIPMPEFWSAFLLMLPVDMDLLQASENLEGLVDLIEYAEPNHLRTRTSLPNDPMLAIQANLIANTAFPYASINMEPAWDVQKGRDFVKVGVLDDPIYWAHEEFGDGTFPGTKVNAGWSWPNNTHISNIANPGSSHGTACAGIIGALSNNGTGLAGIAGGDVDGTGNNGVLLTSLGIANGGNFVTTAVIAAAVIEGSASSGSFGYALDIESNSYGGGPNSQTEYNAIKQCVKNGCVFAASRGNNGDAIWTYPACYRDAYVLNVGASGTDGQLMTTANGDAINSSWGGDMDLIAPGTIHIVPSTVDDLTRYNFAGCTITDSYYDCFRGTSAACPHAAGVAALMMSEQNVANGAPVNLATEDVEFLMERYATDLNTPWYDPQTGWGRLDAGNVMQHLDFPRYRVFHSGTPLGSSTAVVGSSALFSIPSGFGLAAGLYWAEKVQLTETYTDVFPPTTQVLDGWGRQVSTTGVTTNFPSASDDNGVYSFTLNGNQASVVAQTYTWHVTSAFSGAQVNAWIPYVPSQLATAYSLHLYDPTATGLEEAGAGDGFSVFPNPASDVLHLRIDLSQSEAASIRVFDASGRMIRERTLGRIAGQTAELAVGDLADGTYAIQLLASDWILTSRFVKR